MSVTWNGVTLTLEAAFGYAPLAATPVWTDISSYLRGFQITRGRSTVLGSYQTGVATFTLDNTDGRFDPNNTLGPYTPNIKVMTPIRLRATYSATPYDLFYGYAESWPLTYPLTGFNAITNLRCVDGFKLLALYDIGGETYTSESSDTRIGNVLDDVGWPAALRDLDLGVGVLAAYSPTNQKALSHLQDITNSEVGSLFMNATGEVVFNARTHHAGGPTSAATFDASTNLDYINTTITYDDDQLFNDVRITRTGGTEQSAEDATSITDYVRRTLTRTGQPMADDNEASSTADWLLAVSKDVNVRVRSLDVTPRGDPSGLWPQVLGRELNDAITVVVDPPGSGSTLSQLCVIEGIKHTSDARSGSWRTQWNLSPLTSIQTADYWILGTSDDLGTDTVLA